MPPTNRHHAELAFTFLFLGLPACGCKPSTSTPLPMTVEVQQLIEEEISTGFRFSATVKERRRVELSFKVNGLVKELHQVAGPAGELRDVQAGDVLHAGTCIALLDDTDYRRDQRMAEERFERAKAKRVAAKAMAEHARQDLVRAEKLAPRHAISQSDLDSAVVKLKTTEADAVAAEREVLGAELDLQQAADRLTNCRLIVPFENATVATRHLTANERIVANTPVFSLLDLSKLVAQFGVPDHLVGQLQPGQELEVHCDAFPSRSFGGTITQIAPIADERSRTFQIEVSIPEPRGLRPGMITTIQIGNRQRAQLVPISAVQRGESKDECVVFRVTRENGQTVARRARVDVGRPLDQRISLKPGSHNAILPGDLIVVAGASRLYDGQPVRVLNGDSLSPAPRQEPSSPSSIAASLTTPFEIFRSGTRQSSEICLPTSELWRGGQFRTESIRPWGLADASGYETAGDRRLASSAK